MTRALWGRGGSGKAGSAGHYRADLGAYIRELRTARGLTQRDLATAVGYEHLSAISNLEAGRANIPPERYLDFATALHVKPVPFFKKILECTNPWGFAMLYSEDPCAEFAALESALGHRTNPT